MAETRTFDPNTPTELQRQDWTCSVRSTMWMLKSLGIDVTPEEAQDAMSPQYVNSDVGLLDASGYGIVAVLRDHWGVTAKNDAAATFDDVAAIAGFQPIAIGLRNWGGPNKGHWSAVRDVNGPPGGQYLVLANPAGTGPIYGQQTLTRAEFDARGPASMVTIPLAAAAPAPPADVLRGVDVASHQGVVNWPAVANAGYSWAFTKATGGSWYNSPTFAANWLGMKAAGIIRGAYHFAFETSGQAFPGDGPEAEADYFVATLKRAGGIETGDLLALDIEDGEGPLGDWALRWCKRVEATTGVTPMIYTGAWFSVPHGFGNTPALARSPLWLAAYQTAPPSAPAPWNDVTIHQYSDAGTVPGIATPVDMNRFQGSRADLLALGKGGTVAIPEVEYSVGPGIRAAMAARGDEPASSEVYVKTGALDDWSEAMGKSGAIYRWVPATGRVHRYDPAA